MQMIKTNLQKIFNEISKGNNLGERIHLVGASKTMPISTINEAISYGLEIVAENRVQEFREKTEFINGACQHFIGHLQENKVKYLVGKVDLIHSVHSISLAEKINNFAEKTGVIQNILLEINIGREESKSGFFEEEIFNAIKIISLLSNVKVLGLMAMLPLVASDDEKSKLCLKMRGIFDKMNTLGYGLKYLSVGMSNDYLIAIQNGSNMIRLGTSIFGKRN